ncbi:MAG: hypothetical protein AAGD07_02285 [Planctomycetota bacterium]
MHRGSASAAAKAKPAPGVVLLVVLVALVIITTCITQMANRVTIAARDAADRREALQRRWGTRSIQASVLTRTPDRVRRDSIKLGRLRFDVVTSDESAKANLNAVYDAGGLRRTQEVAETVLPVTAHPQLRLRPRRPSAADETAAARRQGSSRLGADSGEEQDDGGTAEPRVETPFSSWKEVFATKSVSSESQLPLLTRRLTIWGSGRLNVWAADSETIIAVCKSVVEGGLARRIADRIERASTRRVELVLIQTVTNRKDRAALQRLLGDGSDATAVWVLASGPSTNHLRFAVRHSDDLGLTRTDYSIP